MPVSQVESASIFAVIFQLTLRFGKWRHYHGNGATNEFRIHIGCADVVEVGNGLFYLLETQFLVLHFTSTELKTDLELVSFVQKFLCPANLGHVIMGVDTHAQLDFFDLLAGGVLLALLLLLALLVLVLPVIENLANGRFGRSGDFYEVETVAFGEGQGFLGMHDSQLAFVGPDDTDFRGPDSFVFSNKIVGSASVVAGPAT